MSQKHRGGPLRTASAETHRERVYNDAESESTEVVAPLDDARVIREVRRSLVRMLTVLDEAEQALDDPRRAA
jgi:hypothetical protein